MLHDEPLALLGAWLKAGGYRFITPTPATHARIDRRAEGSPARSLRDVFGWSRPFERALLPQEALAWLESAGALESSQGQLRSKVRYSSLGDRLFVHSAWPTTAEDAVFFGPDTYRFARFIRQALAGEPALKIGRIADIGCGAGPGGIVAARSLEAACTPSLVLADINPQALACARANARMAGLAGVSFAQGDLYRAFDGPIDLIISNPPYLVDPAERAYRHGGGELGSGLSGRIVAEGWPRLASGGCLLLYTGAPIVEGRDPFRDAIATFLDGEGAAWRYEELDPDVFGEELDNPAYAQAERIAAVGLVARKP